MADQSALNKAIVRTFGNERVYSYDTFGGDTVYGVARKYNQELTELWEFVDRHFEKMAMVSSCHPPMRVDLVKAHVVAMSNFISQENWVVETVQKVYQTKIWLPQQCQFIAEKIDEELSIRLFDLSVLLGNTGAGLCLQKALNFLNRGGIDYPDVPATGNILEMTMNALLKLKMVQVRSSEASVRLLRKHFGLTCATYIHQKWEQDDRKERYLGQIERIKFD